MVRTGRWRAAAAAAVTMGLLLTGFGSAQAQRIDLDDAAGDTAEPGLDFTSVSFRNRDRAVVTVFEFRRHRRGEIIFLVRARGLGPIGHVVVFHRADGTDRLMLNTREGEDVECRGLSSRWDLENATVRVRVPSRCMVGGNYGAVRLWALTEGRGSGSDVDWAPEGPDGGIRFSDWIPRG